MIDSLLRLHPGLSNTSKTAFQPTTSYFSDRIRERAVIKLLLLNLSRPRDYSDN